MKFRKTVTSYPYLLWAAIFIIIPLALVLYFAFTKQTDGETVFTLDNFKAFFSDSTYLEVLWTSVWMAALATFICLILGYPAAYLLSGNLFKRKSLYLLLLIIPMWMNLLLRTYAWTIILDDTGLINTILSHLGIGSVHFMYNQGSIIFGMVYNFLPFMILPIHSVLIKLDGSLKEAARDLGASPAKTFFKVTLPLSVPGIVSGVTMVFMPAVTTFAISDVLSGRKIQLMGNLIETQFIQANNWNFGAAMAIVLMAIILITMFIPGEKDSDKGGGLL